MSGKGQRPLTISASTAGAGPKALAPCPTLRAAPGLQVQPHPRCQQAGAAARPPAEVDAEGHLEPRPSALSGPGAARLSPRAVSLPLLPPDQACQGSQPMRTPWNRRDSFWTPRPPTPAVSGIQHGGEACGPCRDHRHNLSPTQPGHQSSGAFPQGQSLCPGKGQPRAKAPAATGTPAPDTSLLTSITTHQFRIPR